MSLRPGHNLGQRPESVAAALKERDEVTKSILDIQAQLGDRDKRGPGGQRMTEQAYWQWRKGSTYALTQLQKRALELKAYLREQNAPAIPPSLTTAESLLRAAHGAMKKLAREVDLDPDERTVLDALHSYLTNGKTA